MVSIVAFHPGYPGSIPCMDQQIFKKSFSLCHRSGATESSSLKLATSGITPPSMAQKAGHKSYKGASKKAYLLLQGLRYMFGKKRMKIVHAKQQQMTY